MKEECEEEKKIKKEDEKEGKWGKGITWSRVSRDREVEVGGLGGSTARTVV